MKDSLVDWTHDTRNVVRGCSDVDEECRNCYAKGIAARFSGYEHVYGVDDEGNRRRTGEVNLAKPLAYNGLAKFSTGPRRLPQWTGAVSLEHDELKKMFWELVVSKQMRRQFLCSMGDIGHVEVPDSYLDEVFARIAILEFLRPNDPHIAQVVTKRPDRMAAYTTAPDVASRVERAALRFLAQTETRQGLSRRRLAIAVDHFELQWPLRAVHLITSAGRQESADKRVEQLMGAKATVLGVSCEPMLSAVTFKRWLDRLGWVIIGGESDDTDARPAQLDWFYPVLDECRQAKVPAFFKQVGTVLARRLDLKSFKGNDPKELPKDLVIREFPARPKLEVAA